MQLFVLGLVLLLLSYAAVELAIRWPIGRVWAGGLAVVLLSGGSSLLLSHGTLVYDGALAIIGVYQAVNIARLVEGRMRPDYLNGAVRKSSVWLFGLHVVTIAVYQIVQWQDWQLHWGHWLLAIALLDLCISLGLGFTLGWRIKQTNVLPAASLADKELPSVTLAIPARNETESLTTTLETAIASTYPKLEILVLDDCSQDKTADIIRSFAHDGVRFVQGTPADDHWLPKNWAYQTLLKEAAGEIVLFMGVDVALQPQSIRLMVEQMQHHNLDMLGILPNRRSVGPFSMLIQPMRYFWQLAIPKELARRAPVLSTCWLIKRQAAEKLGGFAAVSRMVAPESFFARELMKLHAYRFVRSGTTLGVSSIKSVADQYETAIRTRYPSVRRRPERVLLVTLFEAVSLAAPFILSVLGLFVPLGVAWYLALASALLLIAVQAGVGWMVDSAHGVAYGLNFPIVILVELGLLQWSMAAYEFGSVEWKGRNICYPVMHAIPHLPPANPAKPETSNLQERH